MYSKENPSWKVYRCPYFDFTNEAGTLWELREHIEAWHQEKRNLKSSGPVWNYMKKNLNRPQVLDCLKSWRILKEQVIYSCISKNWWELFHSKGEHNHRNNLAEVGYFVIIINNWYNQFIWYCDGRSCNVYDFRLQMTMENKAKQETYIRDEI
jgi:hypothetical protein